VEELMMVCVAVRPLIVVVLILPADVWVKELMIEASVLATPFVRTLKRLPLLEATLVDMMLLAEAMPLTVLVAVFPPVTKELVVAAGVRVVVAMTPLIVVVRRLVEVA
jgi:hypothetical protein